MSEFCKTSIFNILHAGKQRDLLSVRFWHISSLFMKDILGEKNMSEGGSRLTPRYISLIYVVHV